MARRIEEGREVGDAPHKERQKTRKMRPICLAAVRYRHTLQHFSEKGEREREREIERWRKKRSLTGARLPCQAVMPEKTEGEEREIPRLQFWSNFDKTIEEGGGWATGGCWMGRTSG